MLPEPLSTIINYHRKQPVSAFAGGLVTGSVAFAAAIAGHGVFERGPVQVSPELMTASGVLFITWFALFAATLACGHLATLSRVLLVAFTWFIVSMLQLGVTPHVAGGTTGAVIFMTVIAAIGYGVTTFRLREKHLTAKAEDALVPFRAATVEVPEPKGRLAATRK